MTRAFGEKSAKRVGVIASIFFQERNLEIWQPAKREISFVLFPIYCTRYTQCEKIEFTFF